MTMLKKMFLFMIVLSVVIVAGDSKQYGKELTLNEKTNISDLMKNPEQFVGKKVQVEGTVVSVCSHKGCWIDLKSDKEYEKIRVKVNDGEIVFPVEAVGKKAVVEGVLEVKVVKSTPSCGGCSDKSEKKAAMKTEEKAAAGAPCCGDKVEKKVYQIKGLGAKIS